MNELEPRSRALLALARQADDPSRVERAENRRRLGQKLAALGVTAAALAHSPTVSAAALGATGVASVSLTKTLVSGVLVGALVGGIAVGMVHLIAPRDPPEATTPSAPPGASPPARVRPLDAARGPEAASMIARTTATETDTLPRSEATSPAPPATDGATRPPLAEAPAPRTGAPKRPGPPQEAPTERISPALVGSLPPAPALEGERIAPDLGEALRVLAQVQTELTAQQATRALAELDGYAARAPSGPMEEERRAMRIVALCQLGRPQGQQDAQTFLVQRSNSPLAARVRSACGR